MHQTHSVTTSEGLSLKNGQVVTHTYSGSSQADTGKILGRLGKVSGTHKYGQYAKPEESAGIQGQLT